MTAHINPKFENMSMADLKTANAKLDEWINKQTDAIDYERVIAKALKMDQEIREWVAEGKEIDAEIEAREAIMGGMSVAV